MKEGTRMVKWTLYSPVLGFVNRTGCSTQHHGGGGERRGRVDGPKIMFYCFAVFAVKKNPNKKEGLISSTLIYWWSGGWEWPNKKKRFRKWNFIGCLDGVGGGYISSADTVCSFFSLFGKIVSIYDISEIL